MRGPGFKSLSGHFYMFNTNRATELLELVHSDVYYVGHTSHSSISAVQGVSIRD